MFLTTYKIRFLKYIKFTFSDTANNSPDEMKLSRLGPVLTVEQSFLG